MMQGDQAGQRSQRFRVTTNLQDPERALWLVDQAVPWIAARLDAYERKEREKIADEGSATADETASEGE